MCHCKRCTVYMWKLYSIYQPRAIVVTGLYIIHVKKYLVSSLLTVDQVVMDKILILTSCVLLASLVIQTEGQNKGCPLSSKMTMCSPKCKEDSECFGRKCCSNICNTKSCVPDHLRNQGDDSYKKDKSSATGTYCGNAKCSAFEKCELDRTTKRQRCVRK